MKERLTGAFILVVLVVLLVPELLTGPVRPSARMAGAAQPAEGPQLRSYTIKLDEEARAGRASPADSPAAAAPAAPATEPSQTSAPAGAGLSARSAPRTAVAVASSVPAPPPVAPQATPVTLTNSADKGWMVQLGSFANHSNAQRLAQQLSGRGFQVTVVRGASGRRLFRVLVGPTRDRAGALKMAARLRAAGHSGSIVPR